MSGVAIHNQRDVLCKAVMYHGCDRVVDSGSSIVLCVRIRRRASCALMQARETCSCTLQRGVLLLYYVSLGPASSEPYSREVDIGKLKIYVTEPALILKVVVAHAAGPCYNSTVRPASWAVMFRTE